LAYAYITYRRDKSLSEVAVKRLQTIKDFTEFGSGFKIAMRDLEIRGAGNLLGEAQHGAIDAVGYDMYCQLLSDAVKTIQGEKPPMIIECSVDLKIDAYIPEPYISALGTRLEIYKKIASIGDEEDKQSVEDELVDRFGDIPDSVQNLVEISLVRSLAADLFIEEIMQNGEKVLLYFSELCSLDTDRWQTALQKFRAYASLAKAKRHYILINTWGAPMYQILENVKFLLQYMKKELQSGQ